MLRFRRELRDEVGAAEDHLAILRRAARRRERSSRAPEQRVTPPLARLTPPSRDSPRRDGDRTPAPPDRAGRTPRRPTRRRDTRPAGAPPPPSALRSSPAPTLLRLPEPNRPGTAASSAVSGSTPALAQNTMDEEARLAADAHCEDARARGISRGSRGRPASASPRIIRRAGGTTPRDADGLVNAAAPAPPPDRLRQAHRHAGVDWSVEDARWMAETRSTSGNSSRTSNDGASAQDEDEDAAASSAA